MRSAENPVFFAHSLSVDQRPWCWAWWVPCSCLGLGPCEWAVALDGCSVGLGQATGTRTGSVLGGQRQVLGAGQSQVWVGQSAGKVPGRRKTEGQEEFSRPSTVHMAAFWGLAGAGPWSGSHRCPVVLGPGSWAVQGLHTGWLAEWQVRVG